MSRIPAFINPTSGTADEARAALSASGRFDVSEIEPDALGGALDKAVAGGTRRVLVAGGDGTVAAAAKALIANGGELAILPGGTLNHFARDLGISVNADEALSLAVNGLCRPVDVALVDDKLFLNTSSVGAYVHFVRAREFLESKVGYRLASILAALRILVQLRLMVVELEAEGVKRIYRTPMVFIGVGEREMQAPTLGNRVANGKRGLHVIVVRGRSRARVMAVALNAVARGVKTAAKGPELDSFIVDRCTIRRKRAGHVAVDGEIVTLDATLEYMLKRDALQVVSP